jgi:hypothetical protein
MESHRFQNSRSFFIPIRSTHVLSTVYLNDQLSLQTYEIHDVICDRMLPTKLVSVELPILQEVPKPFLGVGGVATKLPGELVLVHRLPLTLPSPRVAGRGKNPALAPSRNREHYFPSLSAQRFMSVLDGSVSSTNFFAVSIPATGNVLASSLPICTSTEAWSQ